MKKRIPNNLYVGMTVNYHMRIGGPVSSSGHKVTAVERQNGIWVAFITGKSGFVAVEALSEDKEAK